MIIQFIISKILKTQKSKDDKENLAFGLASGLASGLAVGLAFGLAFGLASGLAFGLAFGLASGLAFGLASGLAVGLAVGLAFGLACFIPYLYSLGWFPFIIAFFIPLEIIFLLDKQKIKKGNNKIVFTLWKKFESLIDVLFIYGIVGIGKIVYENFGQVISDINNFLGAYGILILSVIGIFGFLVIYILLNSLKYRQMREVKP